ncbi:MAG: TlpA family protein disulfide reductase, partial [Verrucomicrobia subdivision 3 bacterium]|nr:TlpA family protein disulfide reductase [Limisphaerales bacterium]
VRLSDNKPGQLSNYRGRIVVLEFWATWCGPCQEAMARLQTYSEKYPEWKDKVILLTASVDERKEDAMTRLKAKDWFKSHNVWVETEGIKAYRINAIPTVYIIDKEGKIAAADAFLDITEVVNRLLSE